LILNELPENNLELLRRPQTAAHSYGSNTRMSGSASDDLPIKVVRISPGEVGTVSYRYSLERDGVELQSPNGDDPNDPLEVVLQSGEQVVIQELLKWSIPYLCAWPTLVDVSLARALDESETTNTPGNADDVPF
jgi:hypothetical protein